MPKKNQKQIGWLLKEKYKGRESEDFLKDVQWLNAGEPVDYVIGFTEFGVPPGSCKIDLSKKPLIPRVETEFWVAEAIKEIKSPSTGSGQILRILDIFSGSGCIGIAILKHIKNSRVTFADKSLDAVNQIKINLKLNKVKGRFIVRQSDVFDGLTRLSKKATARQGFDYIFANPPYVAEKKIDKVQKSALKYEPKMALFGGQDGLFYINKFLRQAPQFLKKPAFANAPAWQVFMEFSPEQKKLIEKILKKFGYRIWEFRKDQYDRWRWVKISL